MNRPTTLTVVRDIFTLAILCAFFGFALGCLGPALDAMTEARDVQAAAEDAEAAARKQARRDAAVAAVCGPNAVALEQIDGSYRCATKRGFKTELTARVQL